MRSIELELDLFAAPDRAVREGSERAVMLLLDALTIADTLYLYTHPSTPALYDARVRYRAEPPGVEHWLTVPRVLAVGHGDCEDLACWRAAELQLRGIAARAVLEAPSRIGANRWLYHVVVRLPSGAVEDPSRILGMR